MRPPHFVFLGFLAFFFACASGYVDTIDASPSIETAKALWNERTFAVNWVPKTGSFYFKISEEKAYSKMGLLMPFLYLPCVALADGISRLGFSLNRLTDFFISLVNPFLTALLATVLFLFFRQVRTQSESLLLTIATLTGSLLLPYSKTCHRESLQALLLLTTFLFIEKGQKDRNFFFAGLFIGLGVLSKVAFLVPVLPLVFLVFWRIKTKNNFISFCIPLLVLGAIQLAYNYSSFGHFLSGGYSHKVITFDPKVWKTDGAIGFWAQWVWPHRGLLFYSPLLVGLAFFSRASWRTSSLIAIFLSVLFQTILYSKWSDPFGGDSLGPRYLVVILPLLLVLFRDFYWNLNIRSAVVGGIALFSILLQVTLTSVKLQQYYTMESRSPKSFKAPAWVVTPKIFFHKLAGKEEIYPLGLFNVKKAGLIDVRDVPSLEGLNFWWLHLYRKGLGFVS